MGDDESSGSGKFILFGIIGLLVLIGLGVLGYYLYKRNSSSTTTPTAIPSNIISSIAPASIPPPYPYIIRTNRVINPNDKIYSKNQMYYMMLMADGRVCTSDASDNSSRWCSPKSNPPVVPPATAEGNFLVMQADGNFCVYKGTSPSNSKGALWCSQKLTDNRDIKDYYAHVQNDGRICVHKGTDPDHDLGLLWCS